MSSTLIEPPKRPRRRIGAVTRLSKDPEVRSVQIGVLATIFVHLLILLVAPLLFKNEFTGAMRPVARSNPEPFSIEMPPDAFPDKKTPPMKFVETNPDAPENIPDKTNNTGAQNQQVAQEKPTPDSKSDRPATEGEKNVDSTQIVDGELKQPQIPQPAAPPEPPAPPTEQAEAAKREQTPLSGFEKTTGDDAQAFGSNVAKVSPNPQDVPEKVEGAKDAPLVPSATSSHVQVDPKKPMPRPAITRNVRPAIFRENRMGTMNIGLAAYDARWSSYAQYLQRLIEAVQQRWDGLIDRSRTAPLQGTTVTVVFTINSLGKIEVIGRVDGTADKLGTGWCVSAISPNEGFSYGPWPSDMVAVLGTSQELTFNFLYR